MTYTKEGIFIASDAIDEAENASKLCASFGHHVLDLLDKHSQFVLVVDAESGREWTGAKLKSTILNVASALVDQFGLQPGDVACIKYANSDLKFILCLALVCAGAATGFVFAKDPYDELLYFARKTGLKFLFCQQDQMQMTEQLETDLGRRVVAIAMDGLSSGSEAESFDHVTKLMSYDHTKSGSIGSLPVRCKDICKDIACFTTTSGTSGAPKLVPQTHRRFMEPCAAFSSPKGLGIPIFCSTSFEYISGCVASVSAIRNAYKLIISENHEPQFLFKIIQKYEIQEVLIAVHALFALIIHEASTTYDLSSLKYLFPLGSKLTYLSELRQFAEKHPNIACFTGNYGTSETSCVSIRFEKLDEYLKSEHSGKLMAGVQAKIVDLETGQLLGPNKKGMLHLKSPSLFPGYYDAELKDDPAGPHLRDSTIFDQDGFYITGDIVYFDEDGKLFCLGRHSELLLPAKFFPHELEAILSRHPAVANVCVLGIKHKVNPILDCPRAFIVPHLRYHEVNDGNSSTQPVDSGPKESLEFRGVNKLCSLDQENRHRLAEDIMEFSVKHLGCKKHLTAGIVIIDQIPLLKTSGKMDKNYLRSLTLDQIEIYGDRTETGILP